MNIYLVRHTQVDNPHKVCYGRKEMALCENYLRDFTSLRCALPRSIDKYYSSPMSRSWLLAEYLGETVCRDERLHEMDFGLWEGVSWDDIPRDGIENWHQRLESYKPGGGESYQELFSRVNHFWNELISCESKRDICIVTHGGVVRSILALILKIDVHSIFNLRIECGSIVQVSVRDGLTAVTRVDNETVSQGKTTFNSMEKKAVYKAISLRRDMRHFSKGASLPESQLMRIIDAGHQSPSVGLMQPWRIIHIKDDDIRRSLYHITAEEIERTACSIEKSSGRGHEVRKLKLEGILKCADVLVVSMTPNREDYILGRRTIPEMDYASIGCAIQNMWLSARAEGLGMGWVSLFSRDAVRRLLKMPEKAIPVAILCLGPVPQFYDEPMLMTAGWDSVKRRQEFFCENYWGFEV